MLLALYQQRLDPLQDVLPGSAFWSTVLAATPVLLLFYLLVPRRWSAPWAGATAALVAWVITVGVYGMSPGLATLSFANGVAFGLLPVGWTIFNAMLVYNITVKTGQFEIVRRSVSGLSGDARIQAVLIGFAFGAFLEGAAGSGSPVAICGAMLIGLGFPPFIAAVICLIANTSPVAYGALGTPLITLDGVTGIYAGTLSVMAGHQLPLLSLFVPAYMVRCMCNWKKTWEVWPALLVGGGSFAIFQFVFATLHLWGGPELWPMTDVGGGIFSLVVTAIFLRFWKPKNEWHYDPPVSPSADESMDHLDPRDTHAAEAIAILAAERGSRSGTDVRPLTRGRVILAWTPFALMSICLLLSGLLRQREGMSKKYGPVRIGPVQSNYLIPFGDLHRGVMRDPQLHDAEMGDQKPEDALFNFAWLTSAGTPVLVAAILSMILLRMRASEIGSVLRLTCWQMRIPIPTIAFMLGLSYLTRYGGLDATLGVAFSQTGWLYPYFAAMLGWLGVFLTGTDAGSNALFGSLQKITATQLAHAGTFANLDTSQAQVLICTANSTGGVMGKMIDAQSIVVATAATHQIGREADIFKAVIWHSFLLASIVGLITLLNAYVWPWTQFVPHP